MFSYQLSSTFQPTDQHFLSPAHFVGRQALVIQQTNKETDTNMPLEKHSENVVWNDEVTKSRDLRKSINEKKHVGFRKSNLGSVTIQISQ